MFAVIAPDGTLTVHDRHVTLDDVRKAVGPECPNHVWLHQSHHMVGWVGDDSRRMYPWNPIGGEVLVGLGAAWDPYHGPVVITGYKPHSDWGGPEDLTPGQVVHQIQVLHRAACAKILP